MADTTLSKLVDLFTAAPTTELKVAALKVAGSVGSAKEKSLVKGLLAALDDGEPALRTAAVEAVGQLKVDEALPKLEAFVRSGGPELEAAVHSASQLGARGIRQMSKIMDDATPSQRSRIADVLARSGTGNALIVTAHALLDPDAKVVDAAARSLATQVPSFDRPQRHALAKFLTDALKPARGKRLEPRSEAALIRILGIVHEGKADELFWSRISPPAQPEVRVAALHALGAHTEPGSAVRLQKLLACAAEKDFPIVAGALMILKNVPASAKSAKQWTPMLEAPDVATRRFALERLRGVESAEVARGFLAQLHHPDRSLRDEALAALRGFAAGRQALLEHLLESASPDDAWSTARALAPAAKELTDKQRQQLFKQAAAYHEDEDRRATAAWFLLRESNSGWTRDQVEEKAAALRKKKNYAPALSFYRLLAHDPACSEETRFELAATGLKQSEKDLAHEARATDPPLLQFTRLLQNAALDVAGMLAKSKWLDAEDLFYVGFHFAEQTHRAREFGKQVLEMVVKRSPKSEVARQAKRKLKSEGLV
jgi:HEAT repeat protein